MQKHPVAAARLYVSAWRRSAHPVASISTYSYVTDSHIYAVFHNSAHNPCVLHHTIQSTSVQFISSFLQFDWMAWEIAINLFIFYYSIYWLYDFKSFTFIIVIIGQIFCHVKFYLNYLFLLVVRFSFIYSLFLLLLLLARGWIFSCIYFI